ncbi:MAG: flagellar biosynthetic protein FliR, partial [Stenotrophomonas sp.]|nr:flagellar biosynthetic protein FliR [Stenotrophomonas sp.]
MTPLDGALLEALGEYAVPATLGLARLLACFAWLPYLSSGAVPSRMVRTVLALAVLIGLWPVTESLQRPGDMPSLALAALREVMAGTVLG